MSGQAQLPEGYEGIMEMMSQSVEEVFTMMLATVAELVDHREDSLQGALEIPVDDLTGERNVAFEAVVEFHGPVDGAVILRVTADGAMDIARGLLMLEEGDSVEVDEVKDALGECANMVSGSLKTKALDSKGEFSLGLPEIDARVDYNKSEHQGSLVYRLAEGCTAVEVWLKESEAA